MRCSTPDGNQSNKALNKENSRVLPWPCHSPVQDSPSSKYTVKAITKQTGSLSTSVCCAHQPCNWVKRNLWITKTTIVLVALTFKYLEIFWETGQKLATKSQGKPVISWTTFMNGVLEAGDLLSDNKYNCPLYLPNFPIRKALSKRASNKSTFLLQFPFPWKIPLSKY